MSSNISSTWSRRIHAGKWLDFAAISMALLCGIHCLLTPILLALLPVVASTAWVHEDFHLWMLAFVVPTTALAVFSGCRKHRDRKVMILAATGLALLVCALLAGHHLHAGGEEAHIHAAGCCAHVSTSPDLSEPHAHSILHPESVLSTLGGIFLIAGHFRNFRLCRRFGCQHGISHLKPNPF